jgi:hypothetical protein
MRRRERAVALAAVPGREAAAVGPVVRRLRPMIGWVGPALARARLQAAAKARELSVLVSVEAEGAVA